MRRPATAPFEGQETPSAPLVWEPPVLEELPRLTELTLQSAGDPIDGGGDAGGSTVF